MGGGGGMGMSGSSMYAEPADYGTSASSSFGEQGFGRAGVSSAALDLSTPSVGGGASSGAADSRIATQVRIRRGREVGGAFSVQTVFLWWRGGVVHVLFSDCSVCLRRI